MRYLKRRRLPAVFYDAAMQKGRILATARVKRCGTCTLEVPEADIIVEDGQERCPMCLDLLTAEWKAQEEAYVAAVKSNAIECLAMPPQISIRALNETEVGSVTAFTDSAGNDVWQSRPLSLRRGGAAVTALMKGRDFTATDTLSYSTGISDNSAPVVTSTLITLSLVASGVMAAGQYSLTFNGHTFRNVFAVR